MPAEHTHGKWATCSHISISGHGLNFFFHMLPSEIKKQMHWIKKGQIKLRLLFIWYRFTLVDQFVVPNSTIATLSSTLKNFPASNAVDGNFGNFNVSTCSHTDDKTSMGEAWIFIDLKNTYSIKSVKFWYSEYISEIYFFKRNKWSEKPVFQYMSIFRMVI